ncbi:MAG: hypothetical protein JW741_07515 [Sedimentisphaerales bacterium]|nr:hypothetical protein [Sedimentisphaerales bacterium]
MMIVSEIWDNQKPERRKCQFCEQEKDCKHGPDPFLYYYLDEVEVAWLCEECFAVREAGDHIPGFAEDR